MLNIALIGPENPERSDIGRRLYKDNITRVTENSSD
jgi:hypothetical protein